MMCKKHFKIKHHYKNDDELLVGSGFEVFTRIVS